MLSNLVINSSNTPIYRNIQHIQNKDDVYEVIFKPKIIGDVNAQKAMFSLPSFSTIRPVSQFSSNIASGLHAEIKSPSDIENIKKNPNVAYIFKRPTIKLSKLIENSCNKPYNVLFTNTIKTCDENETKFQISKFKASGNCPTNIKNPGKGVQIIIWDQEPKNINSFKQTEFTNRPGGPVKILGQVGASCDNDTILNSDCKGNHGIEVSAQAGGKFSGLATNAILKYISLELPISVVLNIIEKEIIEFDGPTIINMSFSFKFDKKLGTNPDEFTKNLIDPEINRLKTKFPQLIFVTAAGNENINRCLQETSISVGKSFDWPVLDKIGTGNIFDNNTIDNPLISQLFVSVGSVDSNTDEKSDFSNFGKCITFFSQGGPNCTRQISDFGVVFGTSFSSPLICSLLAIIMGANNGIGRDDTIKFLLSKSDGKLRIPTLSDFSDLKYNRIKKPFNINNFKDPRTIVVFVSCGIVLIFILYLIIKLHKKKTLISEPYYNLQ